MTMTIDTLQNFLSWLVNNLINDSFVLFAIAFLHFAWNRAGATVARKHHTSNQVSDRTNETISVQSEVTKIEPEIAPISFSPAVLALPPAKYPDLRALATPRQNPILQIMRSDLVALTPSLLPAVPESTCAIAVKPKPKSAARTKSTSRSSKVNPDKPASKRGKKKAE